jgi:luciferase family oxidoreductase group 1
MENIKLGLLEFGYYKKGVNSLSIIQHIMDYVVKADELSFSRFWLTEHHNYYPTSPWSNPEILIPIFLGISERIKVGMAGVLINYHSPYRVALDFKLLSNLYPGRVDLGFANGTPPENISQLLRQNKFEKRPDDYYNNIKLINEFYTKEDEIATRDNIIIPPLAGAVPDMFTLSSFFSDENTKKAVDLKLNFSKSLFHDTKSLTYEYDKINAYRDAFYQTYSYLPQVNIALPIVCAGTKQEAQRIAESNGGPIAVNTILGSINCVYDTIHTYQEKFQVNEFILYDKSYDQDIKIETLYKLSETFKLQ